MFVACWRRPWLGLHLHPAIFWYTLTLYTSGFVDAVNLPIIGQAKWQKQRIQSKRLTSGTTSRSWSQVAVYDCMFDTCIIISKINMYVLMLQIIGARMPGWKTGNAILRALGRPKTKFAKQCCDCDNAYARSSLMRSLECVARLRAHYAQITTPSAIKQIIYCAFWRWEMHPKRSDQGGRLP